MTKLKTALLCSAAATLCLGAALCASGAVPAAGLSYGTAPERKILASRMLTGVLPAFPSVPQREAEPEEEPTAEREEEEVSLSLPVFSAVDLTVRVPENPGGAEAVVTKKYPSAFKVNNASDKNVDLNALKERVPALNLSGEGPQILIVHTHTSESYNETGQDWYSDQDTRTTDPTRNMVRMGELLHQTLTERGYEVIHCQKRHDGDFNASYSQSERSVKEYLEKYPSIGVVIDLHRDSLIDSGGTKYRPVTEIDGVKTAQVMLLMGVGNEKYPHPHWEENLSFAARLQAKGEEEYPGFLRPMLVRPMLYNQYLSKGAILVELGACGNSPAEAEAAAKLFGALCASVLDEIREAQQ